MDTSSISVCTSSSASTTSSSIWPPYCDGISRLDWRIVLALSAKIKGAGFPEVRKMGLASPPGRPPATSHAAIERAAFALFIEFGFDQTTTDQIAEAAGIGRRTLFRYFPSKNDIPWGQFDDNLDYFRATLDSMPADIPPWQAVQQSVVRFNSFDVTALEQHRVRMRLILTTPSLQAHSVLMYERWRSVIAEYLARRLGTQPTDLLPRLAAHVSLALSICAYEQWLDEPGTSLAQLLAESMLALRGYLDHG